MTDADRQTAHRVGHSISRNVLSSGLIRVSRAVLMIVTTPVVIALLGPEQYGLVVFTLTVQMVLFMFDQAVSPPIIRQFGRMGGESRHADEMRDLLRSFEWLSLATALVLGTVIVLAAPFIATTWLQAENMSDDHVVAAIMLIGIYVAVQWPSLLYSACFVGLRYQSVLSAINMAYSLIQIGTIILVMTYWFADIRVFLAIQILTTLAMNLVMRHRLARLMPKSTRPPRFDPALLRNVKRFAGGTFLIGITSSVLIQYDKIVASNVFVLEDFSVYGLTFNISAQLAALTTTSIMMSAQPVMAELLAKGDNAETTHFYHVFSQFNALVVFTSLGCLAVFPLPILQLWLGVSSPMVAPMAVLLPYVLIGNIINCISAAPYMLQMAAGWVRLKLALNVTQAIIFVLLVPFVLPKYGMIGGALLWTGLTVPCFLIEAPIVHRFYLKGELLRWWFRDTLLPGGLALGLFFLAKYTVPRFESPLMETLKLAVLASLVGITLLSVMPQARKMVVDKISELKRQYWRRGRASKDRE